MPEENTGEKNKIYLTLRRIETTLEGINYSIRELADLKNREVNPIVNPSEELAKQFREQEEVGYLREQIKGIEKQNKILLWTAIVGWIVALLIVLI